METTFTTPFAFMSGQLVDPAQPIDLGDDFVSLPKAGLLIAEVCLNDMNDQGKGYGKQLYAEALNTYGCLYSVWPVSMEALHVQDSLVRSGIARIEGPDDYGFRALIAA